MDAALTERVKLLAYWIVEREVIRFQKEAGMAPPWTKDPILASYRFTNVRREDDAVTKWIKINWRDPYAEHPNMVAAMVLARLINEPTTLLQIGYPEVWNKEAILGKIKEHRENGYRWLNPAYVVTTCGVKMDKVDYIVDLATNVWKEGLCPVMGDTLEYFHRKLMMFNGLGSFLAGQVVADLKHIPGNALKSARDFMSWAPVGPGSLKGLRAVYGRPDISGGQFLALATPLREQVFEQIDMTPISMQDFQNCLCEFSKYWRAHSGTGNPKQRYHVHR